MKLKKTFDSCGNPGYRVFDGDEIIATTADTSCKVPEINTVLKVRAVNHHGALGKQGLL